MPEQHPAWIKADAQPSPEYVTRYRLIGGSPDDWMDLPWGYRIERDGDAWIARYDERWARGVVELEPGESA